MFATSPRLLGIRRLFPLTVDRITDELCVSVSELPAGTPRFLILSSWVAVDKATGEYQWEIPSITSGCTGRKVYTRASPRARADMSRAAYLRLMSIRVLADTPWRQTAASSCTRASF